MVFLKMACVIAHSATPPAAINGAQQNLIVIRDGVLTFKKGSSSKQG